MAVIDENPTSEAFFKLRRSHVLGLALGGILGFAIMFGFSTLLSLGPKMPSKQNSDSSTNLARDVPDAIFKAPSYQGFVNQNGMKVSSSDFNGKIRVVSFLFPLCTSMCPVIASHLVNLEHQIKRAGLGGKVQLVSFNVAAGKTTPAEMASFMKEYGGKPKDTDWQFLTSSPAAMDRVVKRGYHEYFQMISLKAEKKIFARQKKKGTYNYLPDMKNKLASKVNPDFDVTHSSSLILVGPHGDVRYVMNNADTVPVSILMKKIKGLLKNKGSQA